MDDLQLSDIARIEALLHNVLDARCHVERDLGLVGLSMGSQRAEKCLSSAATDLTAQGGDVQIDRALFFLCHGNALASFPAQFNGLVPNNAFMGCVAGGRKGDGWIRDLAGSGESSQSDRALLPDGKQFQVAGLCLTQRAGQVHWLLGHCGMRR